MTSKEKIEVTRNVILGLLEMDDINVVHKEYLNSLLFRIDTEIIPFSDTIPDEASNLLFMEVLKSSSVILFSRGKKSSSCRITKKTISKFFPENNFTFDGFKKIKCSKYGMAMLSMNINRFLKINGE